MIRAERVNESRCSSWEDMDKGGTMLRKASTGLRIGMYAALLSSCPALFTILTQQCYYSMLDGADGITWSDAVLTEVGQGQAKDVHGLWQELLPKGIPPPETYYVSPLTRTIETADLSFKGLDLPDDKPYRPYIKEVRLHPPVIIEKY